HDDVGRRDVLFESLHEHLHGNLPSALLDFRIALHPAHLFFHFLLGHAQLALQPESLPHVIDDCQHDQQYRDAHDDRTDDARAQAENLQERKPLHGDDLIQPAVDSRISYDANHHHLHHVHDELHDAVPPAKQSPDAFEWIERLEIGRQTFAVK